MQWDGINGLLYTKRLCRGQCPDRISSDQTGRGNANSQRLNHDNDHHHAPIAKQRCKWTESNSPYRVHVQMSGATPYLSLGRVVGIYFGGVFPSPLQDGTICLNIHYPSKLVRVTQTNSPTKRCCDCAEKTSTLLFCSGLRPLMASYILNRWTFLSVGLAVGFAYWYITVQLHEYTYLLL